MRTVFVLLYSVCRSVSVLSCVHVIRFFYICVACCDLDVTIRLREKARGNKNDPSHVRP